MKSEPPGNGGAAKPLAGILAAWAAVLLPLAWGVYQSVVKSVPLFHDAPASAPDIGERRGAGSANR